MSQYEFHNVPPRTIIGRSNFRLSIYCSKVYAKTVGMIFRTLLMPKNVKYACAQATQVQI